MTLTQTAIVTKRFILVFIISIVLGTLGFISYKIWYAYYLASLPPVEIKPDTKYGKLPLPDFPTPNVSSSNFSYSLDTVTGSLPKLGVDPGFEKIIKVYFVTKPYATLLSSEKSKNLADKFGITNDVQIVNENTYLFQDQNKTLTVNLDSGNFQFVKQATPEASLATDPENKLIGDFQTILTQLSADINNLRSGRNKVTYFNYSGDQLIPANSAKEASIAQISLWPKSIDDRLIYTPSLNKSLVSAIVQSSADNINNFLSLDFFNWNIDTTTFATYYAKSPDSAFEDLKSGKGVVVEEPNSPKVSITSFSVGYYLSKDYHPFLLPIYIFTGPSFTSYVSAVDDSFINTENQ